MPRELALLICTAFVLVLLWIERKQSSKVSVALWIPTVWMLVIASKPLATWFGSGDGDAGSPLDQVFLVGLLLVGLFILISRDFRWSRAIANNIWLMLLLGYMLISVLWSEIPFVSFKRWTRELVAVVMAFVVLSEHNPRQAVESLFRKTIYVLIPFSIILIKYFPEYGVQYRSMGGQMWIGVTLQKNGLGRLCLIGTFFLVWVLMRRWRSHGTSFGKYQARADLFVLILTLFILVGPQDQYSATALVSLAAGLVALVGLYWMKKHRIALIANTVPLLLAVIIAMGTLQPFAGGSTVKGLSSTFGRDATLTGRTEIWASLVPAAMRQPMLGSGHASFWNAATRAEHEIGEAHNGYLEVVLGTGFVGLLLVTAFLLSCGRKAQRLLLHNHDWAVLWICFLVMSVVHNITESSINTFTTHLTAILLFLAVCSGKPATNPLSKVARGRASQTRMAPM